MKMSTLVLGLTLALGSNAFAEENDFAHFSFPLLNQQIETAGEKPYITSSDEYSIQVSGKALSKGLKLDLTQGQAMILVSRLGTAQALNTEMLSVTGSRQGQSWVAERISAEQLAQTGVFSGTLALKTTAQVGPALLKTAQQLSDKDNYRITVKEKGSAYRLNMQVARQNHTDQETASVLASIQHLGQSLDASQLNATLVAPNGSIQDLMVGHTGEGQVEIMIPKVSNPVPPSQGMYEVHLSAKAQDKGLTIRRDGKIALAFANKQADLNAVTLVTDKPLTAEVALYVDAPSRYEIRAVLYATDANGTLQPVMETHAAQTLGAGAATLRLPFDAAILTASGLGKPYMLRDVRLFDQRQLGLIDSLAEANL
ncbi:DUF4785 family protein [Aliiglaciecola sp. CAU 1673]|uniref:DUF4785 domain-containing protein n=1 Tax=Aliiglaciecola sp. CAU 1673 TaxID=3032595 RepID=UPI0023DAF9FA|nr:DUF4785 domain-containing protein [Aliiglaciecola sp. CAU 1673]MDF2179518.1 DUF4785 family protein [Aliiglaciecola sp. CAU 1673]